MSSIISQYRELDSEQGRQDYTPTRDEEKLVSHVRQQVTTSDRFKRPLERQIYLSLALYMGKQNVRWNSARRALEEIQQEEWEENPNTNIVRAAVDTLTARTTENQPVPEAVPATTDEDDQSRARLSSQYLAWRWQELDMSLKDVEFTQLLYICGTAIYKVAWDPKAGDEVDYPPDAVESQQFRNVMQQWELMGGEESGIERPKPPRRPMGEDQCEVLNVLEFGWDPGCKDATLKNCQWAFHRTSMHIDEVRARWEKGKHLSPDTGFSRDAYTTDVLKMFRGDTANSDSLGERIEIVEYFERPSPRYPRGLYVVVGGNITLEVSEELPYGELPFVVARHKTVPGRLAGVGAIPDLLDSQVTLNKFDKEYRENLTLTGNTQYFVEEGSLKQELTKQPGAVNEVKRGRPFPQARVAPQPNYGHVQVQQQMEERIWNLAGVSDLARGKIPSGLSGRAVGMATDLEATMMGPTIREKARAYKLIGHRLLKYARDYMEVPRLVRIAGDGMMPEVFEFKRSDITSCDVTIEIASLLPRHPSYRREQLIMMFERGIFGPPQDPVTQRRVRQMLEFGDVSQIYGDNSRARRYAREINMVLRGGTWVHPRPWGSIDDFEVQREERYKYMLTAEYRMLDPQIQMLFERNLAWMDYYLSLIAQGLPWWAQLDAPEGLFPPAGQEPPPQQGPEQGGMQPPPMDAFGMAPEDALMAQQQAQQPPGGLPPEVMAQLASMQQQMGAMQPGASGLDNAIPEMNAGVRGPGVGDFETVE